MDDDDLFEFNEVFTAPLYRIKVIFMVYLVDPLAIMTGTYTDLRIKISFQCIDSASIRMETFR